MIYVLKDLEKFRYDLSILINSQFADGLAQTPGRGGGTKFLKNWLTNACSHISGRSYRALFLTKNLVPRLFSVVFDLYPAST